ncbi:sensor histidine kinase [Dongia sp.]|uniref:sensor histidine kinase n=1 Tax=Dongia sp. TaxID=1977262 RepID=UPI0035B1789D
MARHLPTGSSGEVAAKPTGLIDLAGVASALTLSSQGEEAWIDVIRKMDSVYADLVGYQVELERKNAELEEARAFIDSVLSAMTDVLIVIDARGIIQEVNAALVKLHGKPADSLKGRPFAELLAPESAAFAGLLATRLGGGEPIIDKNVSLRDATGGGAPLSVNGSPRFDHSGRLVGMVLIGRPTGELHRAYAALEQTHDRLRRTQQQLVFAEKMAALGRLVAGVAHELNNPISFVFGNMHAMKRYGERITRYLQAVDKGTPAPELQALRAELKIDRIIQDIGPLVDGTLEGASRVSEIVQDLRRFSSTQKENVETYDLVRVVKTATQWVLKATRVKPDLEFDMPEQINIVGRSRAVHQIIINLVQNAVDVLSAVERPIIRLSAGIGDGDAWIKVCDNGPGIRAEEMDRIFEPFFTTKPVGEGTGLGLYVSYGLAEEQGGHLEVANVPDGGVEFLLTIPLAFDIEAEAGETA